MLLWSVACMHKIHDISFSHLNSTQSELVKLHQLWNTLYFWTPIQNSRGCAWVLPQELFYLLCTLNLWLSFGTSFWRDCQRTANLGSNLNCSDVGAAWGLLNLCKAGCVTAVLWELSESCLQLVHLNQILGHCALDKYNKIHGVGEYNPSTF